MTNFEKYKCKIHHLDFMKSFWRKPSAPLKVGLHTRAICQRIDKAINDFDDGKSTYLIITVPFRHGKSDIISRYLPAHFIGTHPDCDIMLATYSSSLANGFGRFAREIIKSDLYKDIFGKELSKDKRASNEWGLQGYSGTVMTSGMSAGITGKGYHLGILDDYCANREQAESFVMREKAWNSFTNDFFTRQAPISITIILATPWHIDDIIGRIRKKNNKTSEDYSIEFENFEEISFPAMNGKCEIMNNRGEMEFVEYDYLFTPKTLSTGEKIEGRFTPRWYERQVAALGSYGTASLLQCNPQVRGGNLFEMSKVKIHEDENDFPKTKYYRIWDYAHTEQQTQKSDPDWTSGTLLTFTKIENEWHLWIKDVARIRGKSPARDNFVRATTEKDGAGVPICVENSLDSKDAVSLLQTALLGRRSVIPLNIRIDKIARASYLEPLFENGHIHILKAQWNRDWIEELSAFPGGEHDDQVDNLTAGYLHICKENTSSHSVRVLGF